MKLTQRIAREYIGMIGGKLKRNAEYDEYRVKFGEQEYFASDLKDAIATAACMAGGHDRFPDAEEYLRLMIGIDSTEVDKNVQVEQRVAVENECGMCGEAYDEHLPASGNSAPFCMSRDSKPGDTFIRGRK